MTTSNDSRNGWVPRPVVISRRFHAPRERVFQAWGSPEQLQQWFCPANYSVPEAHVEFRAGGAFELCMRSKEGDDHWTRGHYLEVVPFSRIVLDLYALGDGGERLFRAHTVVTFASESVETRLEVTQTYTPLEPEAAPMIAGAAQGWSETLDRLGRLFSRLPDSPLHAASPAKVFRALTDPQAKANWFGGGDGFTTLVREMDVRPGGRECLKARWESGVVSTFDAVYFDVMPDERLVYAYEMHLDDRKISVSLATFELTPAGVGTRLVMTEQGAFLDGYDDAGSRERGSGFLLDALGNFLA
jgi:uncharacterized protein YndB with AHSA1/START domain